MTLIEHHTNITHIKAISKLIATFERVKKMYLTFVKKNVRNIKAGYFRGGVKEPLTLEKIPRHINPFTSDTVKVPGFQSRS